MTSFTISDAELAPLKDKVVVITGASSGIGLATAHLILQHGGKVFASDLNPLPSDPSLSSVPFLRANVSSWTDQVALFKAAVAHYGAIDHVFANAGIAPSVSLLEEDVDENGDLLPPKLNTIDVNLLGVIYTVKLGLWYLKKNVEKGKGGSVVMTASASSFTRFPATDYATTKHAVLGLLRALHPQLSPPLRINAVAPSWTATGIVPTTVLQALGENNYQSADVVARSVAVLMADEQRRGQLVFSERGRYVEIDNGEGGLIRVGENLVGMGGGALEGDMKKGLDALGA